MYGIRIQDIILIQAPVTVRQARQGHGLTVPWRIQRAAPLMGDPNIWYISIHCNKILIKY